MPARMLTAGVALLLLLSPALGAVENGTYIEQEVTQSAVGRQPAKKGVQKIWMTQDHLRNETTLGEVSSIAIFDLKEKRVFLVPTDAKQYLEFKLEDYQRLVSMRLKNTGLNDEQVQPKLTNTGEQRKISEWQCVKMLFEQGGRVPVKTELWVAKDTGIDFTTYLDLMKKLGMDEMLGRLSGFVSAINGYPIEMRTEQTVESQTITSTARVTKIVLGPVDPALFKVPDDYKRLGGDSSLGK